MRPRQNEPATRLALRLALALSLAALAHADASAQPPAYVIEDLGQLPGAVGCVPIAINAEGRVVGWSGESPNRAFLFVDGIGIRELFGPSGFPNTAARGINDAGIVVGEGWATGGPYQALRWIDGAFAPLTGLGTNSRAWDVSPLGVVVGETPVDALDSGAFRYTDGSGLELLAPERDMSRARDINEWGQVAGYATTAGPYGGAVYHAFRFAPDGTKRDLGSADGFAHSYGTAINVSGQVAGSLRSASGNSARVFRYTEGVGMLNLGGVGETNDTEGMNSRGDFVGRGQPTAGLRRAFLYTDEGGLRALNDLVAVGTEWQLLYAYDINDAGQIVGLAWNNVLTAWRGYRLNPTSPVGPLAALSLATAKAEGSVAVPGWVTLTHAAPAGGTVVALTSSEPEVVSVPATVWIPAGERHGPFTATTTPWSSVTSVHVTADLSGNVRTRALEVVPMVVTGVGAGPDMAGVLRVHAPAPNPSRESLSLRYDLAREADVRIRIFDARGRLVRALADASRSRGAHQVEWDGRDEAGTTTPAGMYFVSIEAAGARHHARVMRVR